MMKFCVGTANIRFESQIPTHSHAKKCLGMYRDMWGCIRMNGDAWGLRGEDASFSVGMKKMKYFVWGMRGDVPTQIFMCGDHPHAIFLCMGRICVGL